MKRQLVFIVAGVIAIGSLAAAQVPPPPAPMPAPAPEAAVPSVAPQPAPPAPPAPPAAAAPIVAPAPVPSPAPVAAVPSVAPQPVPPAPPAPPAAAAPIVAPAPVPSPAPAASRAAAVAQQAPPATPKSPRPAKAPEAAKPPEPPRPEATPQPDPSQPPPPGRERGEPDPVNIQFKVTVTAETASAKPSKRVAILTVSNGTGSAFQRGMLRAGNSVPVASTSLVTRAEDGKETPAAKPLTSYNYRAVGLNVDVEQATIVAGNRVRASLNVEFSGVDEKMGPGSGNTPPSFPTFSQRVALYLESGKPVLVAQSTDMATGISQMVEVQATIMR